MLRGGANLVALGHALGFHCLSVCLSPLEGRWETEGGVGIGEVNSDENKHSHA